MGSQYVLAWTTGFPGGPPAYLQELEKGWKSTLDVSEATRFLTASKALSAWLSKHQVPGDYEPCIKTGEVRAERVDQRELAFVGEPNV